MRLAGVCTMNRGGRPRRQINTAELLRLRAEGCSFPEIASRLQVGLGTAYRAYQAATNQATPFQNPKATVLRDETNKTREPVPDSDVLDLPPHLKIKLWLLRARLERERPKTQPHASVSRQHNGGS